MIMSSHFQYLSLLVPGAMNKYTDLHAEMTSTHVLKLLKCLLKEILQREDEDTVELKRNLPESLFIAAKMGNFEFLAHLIRSYPDLVHELDENDQTIFHIAILHGHTNILDLLNEIGFAKELLMTYVDKDQNNILHLAAKYQHGSPITTLSCAALQMQQELVKFKEVEKIVKPYYKEMKNSEGQTPRELFTIEHSELLKNGELWMMKTVSSCMIIASLITMVTFLAAVNVPTNTRENIKSGLCCGKCCRIILLFDLNAHLFIYYYISVMQKMIFSNCYH
ncbi:hypothetical protein Pint_20940 [Pistacia integerrima]|uniref:Uncharacterized protein n=1 Tax=Pistacia integerrima TaxID=434235 RepID=A0ACC0XBX2_9ROSI|nr:hypothetical protein Pint_20940 [Pistacia integerrima]